MIGYNLFDDKYILKKLLGFTTQRLRRLDYILSPHHVDRIGTIKTEALIVISFAVTKLRFFSDVL